MEQKRLPLKRKQNKKKTDNEGRILILDVFINDSEYILIKLYIANTAKSKSMHWANYTLNKSKKQLIMAWDFNLFFDSKLHEQGGNPTLKKKSWAKLIEFKETHQLHDPERLRNTKSKQFTFTQKNSSGFVQRKLDAYRFWILFKNL